MSIKLVCLFAKSQSQCFGFELPVFNEVHFWQVSTDGLVFAYLISLAV